MNKSRLLPLLALVVAFTASAFTVRWNTAPKKAVTNAAYFEFKGTTAGQEPDASNWERIDDPEDVCPFGEDLLCTIYAPIANPTDVHPDFTGISDPRSSGLVSQQVYKP